MGLTARSADSDLLRCECGAPYAVEASASEGVASARLRCTACDKGHDVLVVRPKATTAWTLISPEGRVDSFTSSSEAAAAIAALPPASPVPPALESAMQPRAESVAPAASSGSLEVVLGEPSEPALSLPPDRATTTTRPPDALFGAAERLRLALEDSDPVLPDADDAEGGEESVSIRDLVVVAPAEAPEIATVPPVLAVPSAQVRAGFSDAVVDAAAAILEGKASVPEHEEEEQPLSGRDVEEVKLPALPVASAPPPSRVSAPPPVPAPRLSAPPAIPSKRPSAVPSPSSVSPPNGMNGKSTHPTAIDRASSAAMKSGKSSLAPSPPRASFPPVRASAPPTLTRSGTPPRKPSVSNFPALKSDSPPTLNSTPPDAEITVKNPVLPDKNVTEPPPAKKSEPPVVAKKSEPPVVAKKSEPPPNESAPAPKDPSEPPVAKKSEPPIVAKAKSEPPPPKAKSDSGPALAAAAPSEAKSNKWWVVGAIGLAGGLVWWATRPNADVRVDPPKVEAPVVVAPVTPTTPAVTSLPAPPPTATSAASGAATTASAPATVKSADTAPSATPSASAAPSASSASTGDVDTSLPLTTLLDRAGEARRGGDMAKAGALYEAALQKDGSNVEALSGLGDVARARGDLAAARSRYQAALAKSPSFAPALLGLADIEWDQGDQVLAQSHYRQLLGVSSRAPDRAKQRSGLTTTTDDNKDKPAETKPTETKPVESKPAEPKTE